MIVQAVLRLDISFFALLRLDSLLVIALYWLGNYFIDSAQGWVAKIFTQINISLQAQTEAYTMNGH